MAKDIAVIGRTVIRLLLGGVFVFSGGIKTLDPESFAMAVHNFRLLPDFLVGWVAIYLPWLEIVCGIAVLTRWCFRGSLLLLVTLCGIFCLALTSAWYRGLDIECGCFGQAMANGPLSAIARSVGLGVVAFWLLHRETRPDSRTLSKLT